MKTNPTILLLIALGPMIVCAAAFIYIMSAQKEKIQQQQLRIEFLSDYKKAYMEHINKCDTVHVGCFNMTNYKEKFICNKCKQQLKPIKP